jgi:hypothetical protein
LIVTTLTLPPGSWWSWEVQRYDGATLVIIAGHDLTYHHEIELSFSDVAYIEAPTQFEHASFREPTTAEWEKVRRCIGEEPTVLVAFDIEANHGGGTVPCLIAADAYSINTGSFVRQA